MVTMSLGGFTLKCHFILSCCFFLSFIFPPFFSRTRVLQIQQDWLFWILRSLTPLVNGSVVATRLAVLDSQKRDSLGPNAFIFFSFVLVIEQLGRQQFLIHWDLLHGQGSKKCCFEIVTILDKNPKAILQLLRQGDKKQTSEYF